MASMFYRRNFLVGSAALVGFAGASAYRTWASTSFEDPTIGRKLVFEDQFDTLDWSIWNAGPKATTFDTGFYGRSAFARADGEEGFNPYSIVEESKADNRKALQIAAKFIGRQMNVANYYGNREPQFQWISGNIQTARQDGTILLGWRQGYFEARMLFPKHPLTWPAFWMMNGQSILAPKTSIEIDVVEHKGWEAQLYGAYLHEWGEPGEHHEGTGVPTPVDLSQRYCRYGMLVTDSYCTPYFERHPVIDQKTNMPARWPIGRSGEMDASGDVFWPLLTLALRSDVDYPQPLLPQDHFAFMRVDYVKVYN